MNYSQEFKINVNKLHADEALLILLEIDHPFISDTIRLVSDNQDLISNGENYIKTSFRITRQSDVQGELPRIQLTVPNIGRELVRWIDTSGGGKGASMTVKLVRRSSPNLIEESIKLDITSTTIDSQSVVFNLVVQNNLNKRATRFVFDKVKSPGIF